jgi:hypothetical protein
MPIPFIIAGAALAAGAYGVKKGIDAKRDYDTAESNNSAARRSYREAQERLNDAREETNKKIEQLGALKIDIYSTSLKDFVDTYSKIKNVDFEDNLDLGLSLNSSDLESTLKINQDVLKINELIGGGATALGSGALAGFGAFGGAGMLATASTGTAISSLSGVAATNATLAWFGGGSLAAGGLGMAGGVAVLGGIVAGPVLAVAGGMMASKAQEAKYESMENYDKAMAEVAKMDIARCSVEGINERVREFIRVLEPINNDFKDYLAELKSIVNKNDDFSTYNESNKKSVFVTVSIAKTIKNVCDTPIIDEDGEITVKSEEALKYANDLIDKLKAI